MIDYEQLRAAIDKKLAADPSLRAVTKRIKDGTATLTDSAEYARVLSHILGREVSASILELDDRESVVTQLLHDSYDDVNSIYAQTQALLDEQAGIHINPQKPVFPVERVKQFAHSLIDPTVKDSVIKRRARAGTETITKSFHDNCIKKNAQFRHDAGLKCYIVRIGTKCCDWCSEVAGKYKIGEQPDGIFRRHDNCDCTIIYDGQVLRGKQNADGSRSKTWEGLPNANAADYTAPTLSEAEGRAIEQRNLAQIRGLTNSKRNDIMYIDQGNRKIRFYSINEEYKETLYTEEEIEEQLQKSPIGRYISKCIENDGFSVEMNYDTNVPLNLCGTVKGRHVSVNAMNHSNSSEIAETIIHEVAHEKFSWVDTQEGEVNCRIYEYLHSHETISEGKICEIVKEVREYYSYFPEGDLYGY